jgi:hypothetical protein
MGDLDYKREWSNNIYNFEHHIIYPKNSIKALLQAHQEYLKVSIKEIVYKLTYDRYKKWRALKKKEKKLGSFYKIDEFKNDIKLEGLTSINHISDEFMFIRKPLYDFLYSAIVNIKDVNVYKYPKIEKAYLVAGKGKKIKIVFE